MVAEHSPAEDLEGIPHLEIVDRRKYGGTLVSFLRRKVDRRKNSLRISPAFVAGAGSAFANIASYRLRRGFAR